MYSLEVHGFISIRYTDLLYETGPKMVGKGGGVKSWKELMELGWSWKEERKTPVGN